jgi:hypothetical protein
MTRAAASLSKGRRLSLDPLEHVQACSQNVCWNSGRREMAKMVDEVLALWTKMVATDMAHDVEIENNLKGLQVNAFVHLSGRSSHLSKEKVGRSLPRQRPFGAKFATRIPEHLPVPRPSRHSTCRSSSVCSHCSPQGNFLSGIYCLQQQRSEPGRSRVDLFASLSRSGRGDRSGPELEAENARLRKQVCALGAPTRGRGVCAVWVQRRRTAEMTQASCRLKSCRGSLRRGARWRTTTVHGSEGRGGCRALNALPADEVCRGLVSFPPCMHARYLQLPL